MSWGLKPSEGAAKNGVHWGARAIYDDKTGHIDLLWDRMEWSGLQDGEKPPEKLGKWLDKTALPELRKLVKKNRVVGSETYEVAVENEKYKLIANPRSSYGYLYIGAWEKA